jgi:hypothetical protein
MYAIQMSYETYHSIQKGHAYIEGENCIQIIKSSIFLNEIVNFNWVVNIYQKGEIVRAIKPYEGFGDVDHTIKDLMSPWVHFAVQEYFTGAKERKETP